jgi:hypothetical protein
VTFFERGKSDAQGTSRQELRIGLAVGRSGLVGLREWVTRLRTFVASSKQSCVGEGVGQRSH